MRATYFQDHKNPSVITRVAEENGELTAYTFSTAFRLDQYAEEYKLLNRKISEAELEKLKQGAEELPEGWDPMDYLRIDMKATPEEERLAAAEKAAEESEKEKEKAKELEERMKKAMKEGNKREGTGFVQIDRWAVICRNHCGDRRDHKDNQRVIEK